MSADKFDPKEITGSYDEYLRLGAEANRLLIEERKQVIELNGQTLTERDETRRLNVEMCRSETLANEDSIRHWKEIERLYEKQNALLERVVAVLESRGGR